MGSTAHRGGAAGGTAGPSPAEPPCPPSSKHGEQRHPGVLGRDEETLGKESKETLSLAVPRAQIIGLVGTWNMPTPRLAVLRGGVSKRRHCDREQ